MTRRHTLLLQLCILPQELVVPKVLGQLSVPGTVEVSQQALGFWQHGPYGLCDGLLALVRKRQLHDTAQLVVWQPADAQGLEPVSTA